MDEAEYKEGERQSSRLAFMEAMLLRTEQQKVVILEHSVCPHCHAANLHGHSFSEVLVCVHCKKKYASKVPRPPVKGDILAPHYELAVAFLHSQERQSVGNGLRPLTLEEFEQLSPGIQLLLNRHKAAVTLSVCERIAHLAEQYAQGKINE